MFENIGHKIKILAKVVCWVGIVCSVLWGIIFIVQNTEQAAIGIMMAALYALASWVGSFCLYGFGELIEKVTEIAKNTKGTSSPTANTDETENYWRR